MDLLTFGEATKSMPGLQDKLRNEYLQQLVPLFKLEKDLYLQSDSKTDVNLSAVEKKAVISTHTY